jgi:hypothetical protein
VGRAGNDGPLRHGPGGAAPHDQQPVALRRHVHDLQAGPVDLRIHRGDVRAGRAPAPLHGHLQGGPLREASRARDGRIHVAPLRGLDLRDERRSWAGTAISSSRRAAATPTSTAPRGKGSSAT